MTQKQWNNHTHKQPTNKERNKQTNTQTSKKQQQEKYTLQKASIYIVLYV